MAMKYASLGLNCVAEIRNEDKGYIDPSDKKSVTKKPRVRL